ncbi:MAG: hypothetical protein IPH04_02880 [Saprospirales bacterium]|nr:hypothetical protein [Saprospirales bacterium]
MVFTTAHNDFAIRAFRYGEKKQECDRLPFEARWSRRAPTNAVRKAREHINHEVFQEQIAQLLRVAAEKNFDRITLSTTDGYVFANTKDIARIETYGNYTFVFLAGERHLVSRNLSEFEEMLPSLIFPSPPIPHGQYSLRQKISKRRRWLCDHARLTKVPVSRRRKDALLEILQG